MKYLITNLVTSVSMAKFYPGDFCCTLYSVNNFNGESRTLCYDPTTDFGEKWFDLTSSDIHFDNVMRSYWCGANLMYDFVWNEPHSWHEQDSADSGAGSTKNYDMWLSPSVWGDGISSVQLQPYDAMT